MAINERGDYVQISARIPAELAAGLEQSAEREDRTMSAELRRAIRQYLTAPRVAGAEAGAA
jgi:predicted transcriptional regulator